MRKISFTSAVILLTVLLFTPCYGRVEAAEPELKSGSALMMQAGTDRIMYEKNADAKAYPASTTKIMTGLLAIENLDPTAELTVSETAIQIDRDGSNMGLLQGEVLTVEQLLYGLLVHSANDAANVLAEAVAGDVSAFVDKMNARAAELGMSHTHFVNAHGYHDDEHYTTARDLMVLAKEAMKNELFRQVVATATYTIPPTNKYPEERILSNNNSLLNTARDYRYLYKGAAGIKTGHTSKAGYCLVSYAERDGLGYYCVTLNAPVEGGNASFTDTIALFNYGFKDFALKTVTNGSEIMATRDVKCAKGDEQAILSSSAPLEVLLPVQYDPEKLTHEITTEENIVAPIAKGDILGRVTYYYDGDVLGSADLAATRDVSRSYVKMIGNTAYRLVFNVWVMVPLSVIVLFLIIRSIYEAKKQRLARERRRQQLRRDFYR